MSKADLNYMPKVYEILNDGVYHRIEGAHYEDGAPVFAKKHKERIVLEFNLQEEFPVLTSKFVAWKMFRNEMFMFYVLMSNKMVDFHNLGINFWDDWLGEDNTIGKAYGYQVRKHDLVNRVINTIKKNPNDRGNLMTLWSEEDLKDMNIRPCAFMTMWDVTEGKLNCTLIQRSGDWMVGIPFNFGQYAMLTHMIAHVTGLQVGKLTHIINNAHIYDRHFENARIQLTKEIHPAAKLVINPDVKNFFNFKPEDVVLEEYKHSGKLYYELAVVQNPFKK